MRGYVWIDNDNNIGHRTEQFLEVDDPGFWGRNGHLISKVWRFDSEDESSMKNVLSGFKARELKSIDVQNFCNQIGFDLAGFVSNNKVVQQPFPVQIS